MATEPSARSDVELLHDARAGERAAFDQLYLRHRSAARRLARSYRGPDDADDLVNGAFEQVMAAVLRGGGPDGPLRPYLFVALRRLAMRRPGPGQHEPLDELADAAVAAGDPPAVDDAERSLVIDAFLELPDRWQAVLWQVAVEGRPPREVARGTGMSPNAVSALAYRARERLRQTYLQAHVGAGGGRCAPHRERLGSYVRGSLGRRQRNDLDAHLDTCGACTRLLAELDDVNRLLSRAVLPLFLVGAESGAPALAAGAVAAASGTGASVGASAGATSGVAIPATASLAGAGAGAGVGALGFGAAAKATVFAVVTLVAGVAAVTVPGAPDPNPVHDAPVQASSGGRATPADADARRSSPTTTAATTSTAPTSAVDGAAPAVPGASPGPSGQRGGEAEADAGSPAAPLPEDGGSELEASLGLDAQGGVRASASADGAPGRGVGAPGRGVGAPGRGVGAPGRGVGAPGVGAGVAIDRARGVDLDATWTAGPLGTGTLDVGVFDPDGTLGDATIVVDLSPGARFAGAGPGCTRTDGGTAAPTAPPRGGVACGLDEAVGGLTGRVSLPVTVTGADASATVHVQLGSQRLQTVVTLT